MHYLTDIMEYFVFLNRLKQAGRSRVKVCNSRNDLHLAKQPGNL